MNKKEVQQRVLQDGKPLALNKFTWDEKTRTFSSGENNLIIDFTFIDNCTFKTGSDCTFKTGSDCTFDTGYDCTFDTGSDCTFKTGSDCTFKTGYGCTFKTRSDCTFKTWSGCTFKTGSDCTFDTGYGCVIVRRDIFEVIQPEEGKIIQLCPHNISGYLVDGMLNGEPYIIVDGILSKVLRKKGNVSKVINHGETEHSYIVTDGENHAHGKTIKEAREALVYKRKDRDTSAYNDFTLDTVVSFADAVKMYRTITGACASGVEYFVKQNQDKKRDKYTVQEIVDMTAGNWGHDKFVKFFEVTG